jgi:hypothetical protein
MLVLFDQGTPLGIRKALSEHAIITAREKGWSTLSNGDLLRAAEKGGVEVLLTTDSHLQNQQNLANRRLAVVVLTKARWKLIRLKLPEIAAAITSAAPGTFSIIEIPDS